MSDNPRTPLEKLLGEALEISDPVPTNAIEAAAALHDWVDIDAVLGTLMEAEEVAVRAADTEQFQVNWDEGQSLNLQLHLAEGTRQITGLFEAEGSWAVEVAGPAITAVTAELYRGTFQVEVPDTGPFVVRFRSTSGDELLLTTPWLAV